MNTCRALTCTVSLVSRTILDTKYGLKRWQIGEIASKIGQLYYHYYLRTSETSYLHEAYSFYAAIRGRAYYSRAAKEDRSDLMVKKLRYYARFIVVCLLLNRMKLVRELVQELDAQIADYTSTYEPDDQLEWNLVLDEIKAFVKAESAVGVLHSDSNPIVLTHRLGPQTCPPVERSPPMCLSLQEILIVGNCADQVKFSELSMDMFRMLQTLEREPRDDPNHLHDASPAGRMPFRPGPYPGPENGAPRRDNPHKYLLYKPTYSQVQVFLASGFKELPANGALLLYLSADGCFSTVKHPEESECLIQFFFHVDAFTVLSLYCRKFIRRELYCKLKVCLKIDLEIKIERVSLLQIMQIFIHVN